MPRQEARNYTNPEIAQIAEYHHSRFQSLKAFLSDRPANLNSDYTISENNTASTLKFAKAGSRSKLFGLEWENVSRIANSVGYTIYANLLDLMMEKAGFPDDFWRMEKDITVNAECVTQTFTKAWMRNNYKCWKALYELCESFRVTTNDPRCGMHVNVDISNFGSDSESQQEAIRKLAYLINKHYRFFCVAFHRDPSATSYAGYMTDSKEYWKNFDFDNASASHGNCMNLSHVLGQNRVEIRLVGGQAGYYGFRNTMEVVFHVVERVSKLSWNDLDNLEKVFTGCNTYVFKRISQECLDARLISQEAIEKILPTVKEVNYL